MVRRQFIGLLVCGLMVGLAPFAWALIPDPDLSSATTAATEQVSIFSIPDGTGDPLNNAFVFGGGRTNATVTLTVVDDAMTPIFNYPAEDMWIESDTPDIVLCLDGSIADANTDVNGQTTFSQALKAGLNGAGLKVIINSDPLTQEPLDFLFNSPDMSGDLVVNLTDIVLFADIYFTAYGYAADFYWDGVVNLSDIVLLAQGIGASCP